MLHYAAVFFVIALIAALFGFGGIAVGAAEIAKFLFFVFLVLFVSVMEAACLIAIGVAMVELHGGNRPAGAGVYPQAVVATAAKPAVAGPARADDALNLRQNESYR